jgi:hypothetical protein
MKLLYLTNLVAAYALFFYPAWFSVRFLKLHIINPFSIILAMHMPEHVMKLYAGPLLLIEGGLFDQAYQFAVLMGNILMLLQAISLVVFYKIFILLHVERLIPFKQTVLKKIDMKRAEGLFLFACLISLCLLAHAEFGILNWILNPREGYQIYRVGHGHYYAIAISMLAAAMGVSAFVEKRPQKILCRGLFYLVLGYLFGSKGMLLAIGSSTLVFLWFVNSRHIIKSIILATVLVCLMMVWNLYMAIGSFELLSVISYFDYYKNAADYYREYLSGSIKLFNGEVALTSLWAYVPRAFWPDKPFVYGIIHVNEIFFPGKAEMTVTPAFGGAVEQFADFGVVGVLVNGLFSLQSIQTALLSYLIFRNPRINVDRVTIASAVMIIVQFAPGFGTFLPGPYYFLMLIMVTAVIIASRVRGAYQKKSNGKSLQITT